MGRLGEFAVRYPVLRGVLLLAFAGGPSIYLLLGSPGPAWVWYLLTFLLSFAFGYGFGFIYAWEESGVLADRIARHLASWKGRA